MPFRSFQTWCSPDCAIAISKQKLESQKKKEAAKKRKEEKERRKAERAEQRKKKDALNKNDMRWQHKNTQPAFNRMRVLQELVWFKERGIEPYCISCLKTNMDWCCGHFKTVGAHGNLRYDERNTFLQCNYYCNMNLSGNIEGNKTTIGFKAGLIHRFGEKEGNEIIDYCTNNNQAHKWTPEETEEIRKNARKKIKELKEMD